MLRVSRFVPWKVAFGLLLLIISLLLPLLMTADSFHVMQTLETGLLYDSQFIMLSAATRLVLQNALCGIPLYLGAVFISASFTVSRNGRNRLWVNALAILIIIALVYTANINSYRINYALGIPILAIPTLTLLLWSLDYPFISTVRKIPVMIFALLGIYCINMMPAFNHLPFGRDALSIYVKSTLTAEGLRHALNVSMLACAAACFTIAGLFLLLLHNENRVLQINQLKAEKDKLSSEARIKELQTRTAFELKHLVHDLKTPLTSVQTLTYLVRLQTSGDEFAQCHEYLDHIEGSVEHMSQMISEILYEEHRIDIAISDLLNIVLAQLSPTTYAPSIHIVNNAPDAIVHVNSIRMARALINLIENSARAHSDRPLSIRMTAQALTKDGQDWVSIAVADNGIGIPADQLNAIWNRGVSGQGSSGLGLSFVRDIVTGCGGDTNIESVVDMGTEITIQLPSVPQCADSTL